MRPPADRRRAQAAAEWVALTAAVGAALAAGALLHGGLAARLAARLDGAAGRPGPAALAAAAHGDGMTLLGVRAWLAEEDGRAAADDAVAAAVRAELRRAHPGWGGDLRLHGAPIRGRRAVVTITTRGPTAVRVVGADDEAAAGARGVAPVERVEAGGAVLLWAGVQSLAQRVARALGLGVAAAQAALGLQDPALVPAPGERAGDAVVCRPAVAVEQGGPIARPRRIAGLWRVGVLRAGRLVADAVVGGADPCRAPAAD